MKSKMRQASVGDDQMSGNDKVRIEIQTFLQALNSYPDRFKRNPGITFEEHCSSLIPAVGVDSTRRN
jgi:hypothetical protein